MFCEISSPRFGMPVILLTLISARGITMYYVIVTEYAYLRF